MCTKRKSAHEKKVRHITEPGNYTNDMKDMNDEKRRMEKDMEGMAKDAGKKKIIIITGASSGFGMEFALQLDKLFRSTGKYACANRPAGQGCGEMWLIARRKERLEKLAKTLSVPAKIISMDVTKEEDILTFCKMLENENVSIRMLINSAGFGLMGRFDKINIEEQLEMLDVNCKALTRLTYECIPYLGRNGRIIQLASSAAFVPQQNFAIYAATKSYVLSFSRALGAELKEKSIWVTAVCPGPADTEFFHRAEKYGSTLAIKKLTMVSPERVVKEALRDSFHKKALSVCSLPMKAFCIITKIVPHGWILWAAELMGKKKGKTDVG